MAERSEEYYLPGRVMMTGADYIDALGRYMEQVHPIIGTGASMAGKAGEWAEDLWDAPMQKASGKTNLTKLIAMRTPFYYMLLGGYKARPSNVLRTVGDLFRR